MKVSRIMWYAGTLLTTLAMLAALHVPMNLKPLYERRSPRTLQWDAKADRVVDPDTEPGSLPC